MVITEGKQVGDLYYMVADTVTLKNIVEEEIIMASDRKEMNPYTGKLSDNYVCFTRSLDTVLRNANRWKYGIKLDGDKLSNRYRISPYSFVGSNPRRLRVKTITSYDDGSYTIYMVNWGSSSSINKEAYEEVKALILSQTDEFNKAHKLVRNTGSRRYMGRTIVEQYNYDTKNGGPFLDLSTMHNLSECLTNRIDEMEERIWLTNGNTIKISGCIKSLVVPKDNVPEEDMKRIMSIGLDVMYY